MSLVTIVLASLVALEFLFIMYLETFATTARLTSRIFGLPESELGRDSVSALFKNQGVYNGLIGVLILVAVFGFHSATALLFLLGFIVLVALYGSLTSNPKIILTQGGLALLTLGSLLVG